MRCFVFNWRLQWFRIDEHDVSGVVLRMLVADAGVAVVISGAGSRRPPFAYPFGICFVLAVPIIPADVAVEW